MSGLQFQSFTNADFSTNSPNNQNFAGSIGDKTQKDDTMPSEGAKPNFFSFAFYQQFFDVDTEQVTKRLLNSAIPTHNSFIADFVQPMPDLYGPFWVAVTLVFSIGIFSNIAQYIESEGSAGQYGSDFGMVTGASLLISSYLFIVPLALYATIWYRKSEVQFSYFEILCAYGYSLTIFIPVSILWIIDVQTLRWVLIGISVASSGIVLVKALWPAFKNDPNKLVSFGVTFGVILLHFLLALCFKEYFFDPVHARTPTLPEENKITAPPLSPLVNASIGKDAEAAAKPEVLGQLLPNGNVVEANKTNQEDSPNETKIDPHSSILANNTIIANSDKKKQEIMKNSTA